MKQYFLEDFYPLCGDGDLTGDEHCIAYQLNKKSDNSGYIFAFRRGANAPEKFTVKLKGLCPEKSYTLTDDDTNATFTKSGAELMNGAEITFNKAPGSVLLFYKGE